MKIMSDLQKVVRILSSHIGHTTYLPLAPKHRVVVKAGHMVKMNCIDCYHATLTQTSERTYYNFSAGRECDCTVERQGWLRILFADPGRTEGRSHGSMGFASGHNIDFAFPRLQNGKRQACGTAEAKESNSLTTLNPRNS